MVPIINKTDNIFRYPLELADRAWDNVGLLQENISTGDDTTTPSTVLLTNDLTVRVAQEAIQKQASVVVTYRKSICQLLT